MRIGKLKSIAILSNAERRAIAVPPARIHTLDARQDIVRAGDQAPHSCFILRGCACRYTSLSAGERRFLSFHVAGDVPDLHNLHGQDLDRGASGPGGLSAGSARPLAQAGRSFDFNTILTVIGNAPSA
jgi:hypothetical protein